MPDIFDMLNSMDTQMPQKRTDFVRSPMSYPGGKSKNFIHIIEHLPYYPRYVEPFGGGASVLLARKPVEFEVYNDIDSGVVSFYRCLKDQELLEQLKDWLTTTVHAREEFIWCRDTWEQEDNIVIRAAKWYYTTQYSFGSVGRNFGRATNTTCILSGKIQRLLPKFQDVHNRLEKVTIEHIDWETRIKDFDSPDTVFYLDPPYLATRGVSYSNNFNKLDHEHLLETIFETNGFVAISGYPSELYDKYPWDNRFEWESFISMQSQAEDNNLFDRGKVPEVLWIKEVK